MRRYASSDSRVRSCSPGRDAGVQACELDLADRVPCLCVRDVEAVGEVERLHVGALAAQKLDDRAADSGGASRNESGPREHRGILSHPDRADHPVHRRPAARARTARSPDRRSGLRQRVVGRVDGSRRLHASRRRGRAQHPAAAGNRHRQCLHARPGGPGADRRGGRRREQRPLRARPRRLVERDRRAVERHPVPPPAREGGRDGRVSAHGARGRARRRRVQARFSTGGARADRPRGSARPHAGPGRADRRRGIHQLPAAEPLREGRRGVRSAGEGARVPILLDPRPRGRGACDREADLRRVRDGAGLRRVLPLAGLR